MTKLNVMKSIRNVSKRQFLKLLSLCWRPQLISWAKDFQNLEDQRWRELYLFKSDVKPGTSYDVADEIGLRELHSELYSVSGNFDLCKMLVPENEISIDISMTIY